MARQTKKTNKNQTRNSLDFSQPWELSDVVLLVEGYRFHVHRSILGMWSPVFSRMFASEFKEKTAKEIPLPRKKASEIHEMLLVIYPTSSKHIDECNFFFLLNFAREYMMTKLTEKCEDYLIDSLEKPQQQSVCYYGPRAVPPIISCRQPCLDLLEIAQEYELETLQATCVEKAQNITFGQLKEHKMYPKINFSNYRKIVEGRMEILGKELRNRESQVSSLKSASESIKSLASKALKDFEKVVSLLVLRSPKNYDWQEVNSYSLEEKIAYLSAAPVSFLCDHLSELHCTLDNLNQKVRNLTD